MKYCIIITDGASDYKIQELGKRTPLEAANKPNIDNLVKRGMLGTVQNVPEGFPPGSDVAIMSLLGNNPALYYTGRAPIEAAAQDIQVLPGEWVFRCNMVTITNDIMKDHSAGNITTEEAKILISTINEALGSTERCFYPGVSYRNLLVYKKDFQVKTTPPHSILDKQASSHYPTGAGAEQLKELIIKSQEILEKHPVNQARIDNGLSPATSIWFWGEGTLPRFDSFYKRYGLKGAVISAVDLVRGLGKLMGWEILPVEGATGYVNTNYKGKGARAIAALKELDLVCVHIEAPDEAGHNGHVQDKIKAIEMIDRHIVGPIVESMLTQKAGFRILVMPDHPTPCALRDHVAEPVPFVIAGTGINANGGASFTEAEARQRGLHINKGHELIEKLFLK